MSTKQNLIKLFEEKRGKYLSGEDLAESLGVSRAAVWKGVNSLREEGFVIDAVTNKGYMLNQDSDAISMAGIRKHLFDSTDVRIEIYDELDSTNKYLRGRVEEDEGLVVIAREQSAGIARNGKNFFSPKDTGIYFSILLKPCTGFDEIKHISELAGMAVCKAIKMVCCEEAHIEGINDIYIDEKKVCGMLTSVSYNIEEDKTEYVILGMGVNMYPPDKGFPSAIKKTAGTLLEKPKGDFKNHLVAEILNEFWKDYKPKYTRTKE